MMNECMKPYVQYYELGSVLIDQKVIVLKRTF